MQRFSSALVLLFAAVAGLRAQGGAGDDRAALLQSLDAKREGYANVAKQI